MARPHDRSDQHDENDRQHKACSEPDSTTEVATQLGPAQHVDQGRDIGRKPHRQNQAEQCQARVPAHEIGRAGRHRDSRGADQQQPDPGRRADEHHNCECELIAAHRPKSVGAQEMPILHVALAPAQIATDEFDQSRRILLEARPFLRQHPHLVTRLAHEHGFDLIVAEHMALDRAFLQHRQIAVRHERGKANDGIMPPVRSAIALPPGTADRVGAHAEPHAELKDTGKGARGWHTDHQRLQNAQPRIDLHDAHQFEHELHGHDAVGVEHDRKIVVLAPAPAELGDIARLEPGIAGAAAVGEADAAAPGLREMGETDVFGCGDGSIVCIAEDIEMEALAHAARGKALHHGIQQPGDAVGRLVANTKQDRGRSDDRLIPAHAAHNRCHRGDRIGGKAHDREPDRRIPEADHVPGQSHGK